MTKAITHLGVSVSPENPDWEFLASPMPFDPEKAVEGIIFLAERISKPAFHSVSKLFYFADRKHLREYGRLICGDQYVAMQHGPVPSGVYDIMKDVRNPMNRMLRWPEVMEKAVEGFMVHGFRVVALRSADTQEFSDSDEECLQWAVTEYGCRSFKELTDASHADEPWQQTDENDLITLEAMTLGFENRERLLEYLKDPFPG